MGGLSIGLSIFIVIIMLGLLVTVHELGHFWVAKLLGIKAYEVSIFVGPQLFHWKGKDGVEYSIRAIPIGAYVRFTDIDEEGNVIESDDPDLLINNPRWKRLIVSIAGPLMNFLLGTLILFGLFSIVSYPTLDLMPAPQGTQLYNTEYQPFDTIVAVDGKTVFTPFDYSYRISLPKASEDITVTLRSKETGELYDIVLSPELDTQPSIGIQFNVGTHNKYNGWYIVYAFEQQNGGNIVLNAGDYLVAVDGVPVSEELIEVFDSYEAGDVIHITYVHNGQTYEDDLTITTMTLSNGRGIRVWDYRVESLEQLGEAALCALKMTPSIMVGSVLMIENAFKGEEEVYNVVSGPIGVTTAVNDVVTSDAGSVLDKVYWVILLCGVISIGLVFTNMLPIPGLDGVQILLITVEMIMGRKISKKAEGVINVVGFCMLIALVLFAFSSDIIRIIVER